MLRRESRVADDPDSDPVAESFLQVIGGHGHAREPASLLFRRNCSGRCVPVPASDPA